MTFLCLKIIGTKMNIKGIIVRLILLTFIHHLKGVTGIQNEPTSSRAFRDEIILSASSFEPAKASSFVSFRENNEDSQENFDSTHPTLKLESSRGTELDGTESSQFKWKVSSRDNPLDTEMTASKYFEDIDENNIEGKAVQHYEKTVSTQTALSGEGQGAPRVQTIVAEPHRLSGSVPPLRRGRQETPMTYNDDRIQSSMQADTPNKRQANPDIQDIITGIVKLLNGNVNVAVNTLRPHKPVQATRINNRGPPRISEFPPLPLDFDTPGMNPPPPPQSLPDQPYPFETPPAPEKPSINQLPPAPDRSPARPFITGIPLGDSMFPQKNRPWNNRPQRPSANRRPAPPNKPLSSSGSVIENSDKKKQNSSLGLLSNSNDSTTIQSIHVESYSEAEVETAKKPPYKFQPPLKQEKINTASTLILGANLQPIPIPSRTETLINTIAPSPNTVQLNISTLKIETSSSVQVIEPTKTIIDNQPSLVALETNNNSNKNSISSNESNLEPSKSSEIVSSSSDSPTPTEGLIINPSSITESSSTHRSVPPNTYSYRPRPGIVLDDTLDYTKTLSFATQRPYAPPRRHPQIGDIFDVTVSAIQGPGGGGTDATGVRVSVNGGGEDVILTSAVDGQGFVSIDGKRTHLNLFDNTPEIINPTKTEFKPSQTPSPSLMGTGYAVPQLEGPSKYNYKSPITEHRRPTFFRKTTTDAVRIDTCIVGDSSTCDASQHEACATVQGVSACHCKPGYARIIRTLPCKRVISIVVSIRVDRIYDSQIVWANDLTDRNSEAYQQIVYESNRAIESAMSMTPFSDEYMGSSINSIYHGDISQGQGGVFINATLKLIYEPRTARQSLASELQKHLLGVIHRRNNNIGNSALFVNSPAGSISNLQDLDECASSEHNDCHSSAVCTNTWGGFTCSCKRGLKDPHIEDSERAGRFCISCLPSHCNNRGTCSYQGSLEQCSCTGNYYGAKCEIDGEVVAVAIGASVAALIIIILTLVCLVMWSRRWSREQKTVGSSPVYGYMQGTMPGTLPGTLARVGSIGTLASVKQGGGPSNLPPYLWGHMTDHIAAANLYASEPMGTTRPSSAVFGYPTINVHGTLPPVPLPRLQAPPRSRPRHQPEPDSSDSDQPQDKDRADLIPQNSGFHVPRPKSRSSLANQSGIYYDVEYDQGDFQHLSKNNIPMSTYSMARPYYRT